MADESIPLQRVIVDGKFFRLGGKKFFVKGVAYGPFAQNAQGEPFASPEQTARDFAQIVELGANVVRVYHAPPRWFLDLAQSHALKLFVDIPWNLQSRFVESHSARQAALDTVRDAVMACRRHPAIFAYSVANEIPPDAAHRFGAKAVSRFIDELILTAKKADPDCLCAFTNFPPTEFLHSRAADFVCFNVYLHEPQPFTNYLAHLQTLADDKPLLLGELGIDSLREGEPRKCEILAWQIELAARGGLAGAVVFSFTDDWFKDGRQIEDWQMGLTTRDRQPKESFRVVREKFLAAPYFPPRVAPKVSVVVASYNGGETLRACLDSLARLNFPDYEIILVDDGSTDGTQKIAADVGVQASACPPDTLKRGLQLRSILHEKNLGLSVARNTGIAAATGEIVAFTDSDCRVDEDWLHYLVGDLLRSDFAGIGGSNFLPPEDDVVAAVVAASPGGPTQVMLSDREAEHIPGCNMAFYKHALDGIGGFDPVFRSAGDDVDICWRMQQAGHKLGFSPAAFVWHHRRPTLNAYLRQQRGYGEAEALLARKHPKHYNRLGHGIWRGRIYATTKFSDGMFQTLYANSQTQPLLLCTALEFHALVTLPFLILACVFPWVWPLAIASLLLSIGVCLMAGTRANVPQNRRRWWSRSLVALMFFLQPIVRGATRYAGRVRNIFSFDRRAERVRFSP